MSFLYLEARKGILRRYTLIALALFLCLNTVKIIADYRAGEIRPVAANTSGMQTGYNTIYERIKGPITEETVRFLTSEYQRLDDLTADGTYSREPQEGTYSGYIFGDYYLLHSYFYPHMEYSVKYSSDMEEILAQAKENVTFYQESGNVAGAAENAYILNHYSGRTIPAFYLYDGWEALLSYDFSDLLILLLLILAVAPTFTRERENGMTLILSSCKRGRWPLLFSKCGAGVMFAWILTILFALSNLLVFGLLCGFEGWSSPLYAIESYQYTPFSGSILLFYGLMSGMKAIGFSVTALLLIFLSACFQKSLYPCLMGLGLGVALNYCAGWALSPVWWKQVLACISPFTLTSGSKLLESLSGVSIGGIYLLRLFVVLIVQAVIACLLVIAIRRKSCCK